MRTTKIVFRIKKKGAKLIYPCMLFRWWASIFLHDLLSYSFYIYYICLFNWIDKNGIKGRNLLDCSCFSPARHRYSLSYHLKYSWGWREHPLGSSLQSLHLVRKNLTKFAGIRNLVDIIFKESREWFNFISKEEKSQFNLTFKLRKQFNYLWKIGTFCLHQINYFIYISCIRQIYYFFPDIFSDDN